MDYKEIQGFMDSQGRLTAYPAKRRKKIIALYYLAQQIPAGKSFTERELNELLNRLHTFGDPASLRRDMYNLFLINRAADGSQYSVNSEAPGLEELLERYAK